MAGFLLLIGSVQFLLAMLVAEGMRPAYSVSADAISDLGVGSTAALFNTSVALLGVLGLAGVYFYHRTHRKPWLTAVLGLAAIGPIGVGLFPETSPLPHTIFALLAFLFGGLSAILTSSQTRPPFRYLAVLLGVVGLVAFGLFTTGTFLGIGLGGMERMIVYPITFWEMTFGAYLMASVAPPASPGAPA